MTNTQAVYDAYRYTPISPVDATNLRQLTAAITSELDRLDDDIETVRDQKHVATATGKSLSKLGRPFGIDRQDGETDAHLRQRIRLRGHATRSGATTDELIALAAVALETDVSNLTITTDLATNQATFEVEVSTTILSNATLTEAEIERLCGLSLPAGHSFSVVAV